MLTLAILIAEVGRINGFGEARPLNVVLLEIAGERVREDGC